MNRSHSAISVQISNLQLKLILSVVYIEPVVHLLKHFVNSFVIIKQLKTFFKETPLPLLVTLFSFSNPRSLPLFPFYFFPFLFLFLSPIIFKNTNTQIPFYLSPPFLFIVVFLSKLKFRFFTLGNTIVTVLLVIYYNTAVVVLIDSILYCSISIL